MTQWARAVRRVTIYAVARGRLSCVLAPDYESYRALTEGVSGAVSKKFQSREAAVAWLHGQNINPY